MTLLVRAVAGRRFLFDSSVAPQSLVCDIQTVAFELTVEYSLCRERCTDLFILLPTTRDFMRIPFYYLLISSSNIGCAKLIYLMSYQGCKSVYMFLACPANIFCIVFLLATAGIYLTLMLSHGLKSIFWLFLLTTGSVTYLFLFLRLWKPLLNDCEYK